MQYQIDITAFMWLQCFMQLTQYCFTQSPSSPTLVVCEFYKASVFTISSSLYMSPLLGVTYLHCLVLKLQLLAG